MAPRDTPFSARLRAESASAAACLDVVDSIVDDVQRSLDEQSREASGVVAGTTATSSTPPPPPSLVRLSLALGELEDALTARDMSSRGFPDGEALLGAIDEGTEVWTSFLESHVRPAVAAAASPRDAVVDIANAIWKQLDAGTGREERHVQHLNSFTAALQSKGGSGSGSGGKTKGKAKRRSLDCAGVATACALAAWMGGAESAGGGAGETRRIAFVVGEDHCWLQLDGDGERAHATAAAVSSRLPPENEEGGSSARELSPLQNSDAPKRHVTGGVLPVEGEPTQARRASRCAFPVRLPVTPRSRLLACEVTAERPAARGQPPDAKAWSGWLYAGGQAPSLGPVGLAAALAASVDSRLRGSPPPKGSCPAADPAWHSEPLELLKAHVLSRLLRDGGFARRGEAAYPGALIALATAELLGELREVKEGAETQRGRRLALAIADRTLHKDDAGNEGVQAGGDAARDGAACGREAGIVELPPGGMANGLGADPADDLGTGRELLSTMAPTPARSDALPFAVAETLFRQAALRAVATGEPLFASDDEIAGFLKPGVLGIPDPSVNALPDADLPLAASPPASSPHAGGATASRTHPSSTVVKSLLSDSSPPDGSSTHGACPIPLRSLDTEGELLLLARRSPLWYPWSSLALTPLWELDAVYEAAMRGRFPRALAVAFARETVDHALAWLAASSDVLARYRFEPSRDAELQKDVEGCIEAVEEAAEWAVSQVEKLRKGRVHATEKNHRNGEPTPETQGPAASDGGPSSASTSASALASTVSPDVLDRVEHRLLSSPWPTVATLTNLFRFWDGVAALMGERGRPAAWVKAIARTAKSATPLDRALAASAAASTARAAATVPAAKDWERMHVPSLCRLYESPDVKPTEEGGGRSRRDRGAAKRQRV